MGGKQIGTFKLEINKCRPYKEQIRILTYRNFLECRCSGVSPLLGGWVTFFGTGSHGEISRGSGLLHLKEGYGWIWIWLSVHTSLVNKGNCSRFLLIIAGLSNTLSEPIFFT